MKKFTYLLVFAAALMLASCAGNAKNAAATEAEETEVVEEAATECEGQCDSCANAEGEAPAETPAE